MNPTIPILPYTPAAERNNTNEENIQLKDDMDTLVKENLFPSPKDAPPIPLIGRIQIGGVAVGEKFRQQGVKINNAGNMDHNHANNLEADAIRQPARASALQAEARISRVDGYLKNFAGKSLEHFGDFFAQQSKDLPINVYNGGTDFVQNVTTEFLEGKPISEAISKAGVKTIEEMVADQSYNFIDHTLQKAIPSIYARCPGSKLIAAGSNVVIGIMQADSASDALKRVVKFGSGACVDGLGLTVARKLIVTAAFYGVGAPHIVTLVCVAGGNNWQSLCKKIYSTEFATPPKRNT